MHTDVLAMFFRARRDVQYSAASDINRRTNLVQLSSKKDGSNLIPGLESSVTKDQSGAV